MIRTSQLTYSYRGQPAMVFPDINCESGDHALILGPSGAGKTTLLHLLGGIITPHKGKIIIGEIEMNKLKGNALDKFRGKHIGFIFQKPHFIKSINALENILLAQSLSGIKQSKDQALNLMERLAIRDKKYQMVSELSIGEQQRLGIVRALVAQPDIILADEPTSALDDDNCFKTITLLKEVANENKANLIIVTHDSRIKEAFEKQIYL